MAAQGTLVVWRAVFAALGVLMVATLVYTCATDGSPFRPELLTPWMVATLADFYVNVIAISAWVIYKEANWISSAIWIFLLVCFGSAATCSYIVRKLFEVTPTGSLQDPLDLLFLRQGNLSQRKCSYVIIGRIVFSILGIFMAAVVTYTVVTDGLPFRKDLLTPWMTATLIDFYINVFAISVWVAHKESTWISIIIWICLLICFGSLGPWVTVNKENIPSKGHSVACMQEWICCRRGATSAAIAQGVITTCFYIVIQLFQVSYQDPIYHVLLNSHSKYGITTTQ